MATITSSLFSSALPALTSQVTGTGQAASPGSPAPSPAVQPPALDPLANEQTFLKLMVAQMQNQDPLNPADSTQFVAQLAQFSQLEQSLAMRQDLDGIKQSLDQLVVAGKSPTTTPAP